MAKIVLLDSAIAPARSRDLLKSVQAKIKTVPNLYKALAHSPAALNAYLDLADTLNSGELRARYRESIAIAISEINRCDYCLSAHVTIGKMNGLSPEAIDQARHAESDDPKLNAILRLVARLVLQRGLVSDTEFESARQAGVTEAEFAEIAAHIGMHTFSNYFNNLVKTEIDFPRVALEK
jgi:uncharacterized peroxidase-related enzyme